MAALRRILILVVVGQCFFLVDIVHRRPSLQHVKDISGQANEPDSDRCRMWRFVLPEKQVSVSSAKAAAMKAARKQLPGDQLATIYNGLGMKFALIPSGEFQMGSPATDSSAADPAEKPQHLVRITRPFYLSVYEVTRYEYEIMMGVEPWKNRIDLQDGPNCAATHVSWKDAVESCRRLSEAEGLKYYLPTDAQWEYACRATTNTIFTYTWGKPNLWGLYDMEGSVWEWCWDWYGPYEDNIPVINPVGPAKGKFRVLRGGSFAGKPAYFRPAKRARLRPDYSNFHVGFRPARSYP